MGDSVSGLLRSISAALQTPTIIILLLLMAATIVMLGTLIAEAFTERRRMRVNMPLLIDEMQGKRGAELWSVIEKSALLKRQKATLKLLIDREALPDDSKEALARELLYKEEELGKTRVKLTDLIAKLAPMFGLLGTLIPLGPGLIALGQGDTKTLSESLLIAFDTTVAGLISAAVALVISSIRKRWYGNYGVAMETIMECILDDKEDGEQ